MHANLKLRHSFERHTIIDQIRTLSLCLKNYPTLISELPEISYNFVAPKFQLIIDVLYDINIILNDIDIYMTHIPFAYTLEMIRVGKFIDKLLSQNSPKSETFKISLKLGNILKQSLSLSLNLNNLFATFKDTHIKLYDLSESTIDNRYDIYVIIETVELALSEIYNLLQKMTEIEGPSYSCCIC